jgi:hypothetical protein
LPLLPPLPPFPPFPSFPSLPPSFLLLQSHTSVVSVKGRMKPRQVLRELEKAMPENVVVSTDIGNVCSVSNSYLRFNSKFRKFSDKIYFSIFLEIFFWVQEVYFENFLKVVNGRVVSTFKIIYLLFFYWANAGLAPKSFLAPMTFGNCGYSLPAGTHSFSHSYSHVEKIIAWKKKIHT